MITLLCIVLGLIAFGLAAILLLAGVPIIVVVAINSVIGYFVAQGIEKLWHK